MIFKRLPLSDVKNRRILTVLDIGSSKVSCFILEIQPKSQKDILFCRDSSVSILGHGVCRACGIKSGIINDMREAEKSIKQAVSEAEEKANIQVRSILVAINSPLFTSNKIAVSLGLDNRPVDDQILNELANLAQQKFKLPLLHCFPLQYRLDKAPWVENPLDMVGKEIEAHFQIISLDPTALSNIELCLQRCYLEIEAVVAAPIASSLAVLFGNEAEAGAICIDIGYDVTSYAVYNKSKLIDVGAVACGGNYITKDIQRGLNLSLQKAEELKLEKGLIDLSEHHHNLTRIITARAEEILQLVKEQLLKKDANIIKAKMIILTGGCAYLGGFVQLAEKIFNNKAKLARPLGFNDLPDFLSSGAYSTALGLAIYPQYLNFSNLFFNNLVFRRKTKSQSSFKWLSCLREFFKMFS